jgi:hypothetical protein
MAFPTVSVGHSNKVVDTGHPILAVTVGRAIQVVSLAHALGIVTCPVAPGVLLPAVGLFPNVLFNSSPSLGHPTIGQTHILLATNLATSSPGLMSPTLGQTHLLTATSLATSSPGLTSPTIGQKHVLLANALATTSPSLGSPTIGQTHVLTPATLATTSPGLTFPTIGQTHVLTANQLATASPGLTSPVVGQKHVLTATNLATTSPGLTSPSIGQTHVLVANHLATSSPGLTSPTAGTSAPWTPSSLTTVPTHWIDAKATARITKDGSNNVSAYADLGSSAVTWADATSNTTNQPLYVASSSNMGSQPVLRASNATQRLTASSIPSAALQRWGTSNNGSAGMRSRQSDGVDRTQASGFSVFAPRLLAITCDGANLKFWQDGVQVGSTVTGLSVTAFSIFTVVYWNSAGGNGGVGSGFGRLFDGASSVGTLFNAPAADRPFDGDLGELLTLSYVATTTDRQLIEGYAMWRWGLQANLPGGHPYASAAP